MDATSIWFKSAHQTEELTAHSFRHYLATYLLGRTVNLTAVQRILGHADPRTTERYAEQSHARLRQVHEQAMEPSDPGEGRRRGRGGQGGETPE